MQLALALPCPEQPKRRPDPFKAAFLASQARKAARIEALRHPADPAAATLARWLFDCRNEVSANNESLLGSPAAQRWAAACHKAGLVVFRICPYFNKRLWRAR